jgi:hypothetical protein
MVPKHLLPMSLLVPNELVPEGEGLLLVGLVKLLVQLVFPGMVGSIDGLNPVGVGPGVALGRVETLVPEELLDTLEKMTVALELKPYELFLDDDDIEAFNREELIARYTEKAKRYVQDGLEKAAKESRAKK